MEIRQKEEGDIRKNETHIRSVDNGIRIAGGAVRAAGGTGKGAARTAGKIAASGKNMLRPADIRKQLRQLTPEQRRQWRSYSYRKQTQILKKAEGMSIKAQSRGMPSANQPQAKMIAHQLNRLAKGRAISNGKGTKAGEKYTVVRPKGETAAEIRENARKGRTETVTFYSGNEKAAERKAKKLMGKYEKAVKRERRGSQAAFRSALLGSIDKDIKKSRQIKQMQGEMQAGSTEFEQMSSAQILRATAAPLRMRVNYIMARLQNRMAKAAGNLLIKYFLPFLAPVGFVFVIFMLLLGGLGGSPDSGSGASGSGGQRMVQMALSQLGNTGGEKYWSYMGYSSRISWCASFVSWCGNECGYSTDVIPHFADCGSFRTTFEEQGRWHNGNAYGGTYIPTAGDLILFNWDSSPGATLSHIGIVKSSDGAQVHTVEGNTSDSVAERSYALGSTTIIGYCTPPYPQAELTGGNNAEMIFNYLLGIGFKKAPASAVVGNLYAEGGSTPDGDIDIHSTEMGYGDGVGMVQWSGGRRTAFLNYCEQRGQPFPETGLEVQIDYMLLEFNTDQWIWSSIGAEYGSQCNISKEAFMNLEDVDFATRVWCAKYERCYLRNSHLDDVRIPMARAMYDSH